MKNLKPALASARRCRYGPTQCQHNKEQLVYFSPTRVTESTKMSSALFRVAWGRKNVVAGSVVHTRGRPHAQDWLTNFQLCGVCVCALCFGLGCVFCCCFVLLYPFFFFKKECEVGWVEHGESGDPGEGRGKNIIKIYCLKIQTMF